MAGMASILAGARGYSNTDDKTLLALMAISQMFSGLGRASSSISNWLKDEELMKFRRTEEERKKKRWEWEQEDRPLQKEAQRSLVEARKRALAEGKERFPLELQRLQQQVETGAISVDEAKRQQRIIELKQKALRKIAGEDWRDRLQKAISEAKSPEEAQAVTEAAREWRTAIGESFERYTAGDLLNQINSMTEMARVQGDPGAIANAAVKAGMTLKTKLKDTPEFRKIARIKDPTERLAAMKAFFDQVDPTIQETLTYDALNKFYFNRRKLRKDGQLVSILQTPEFEDPKLIAKEIMKFTEEDPITAMGLLRFYKPTPEGLAIDTNMVKQYIQAPLIKKVAEFAQQQPGATPEQIGRQLLEFSYQMGLRPETQRLYQQGGKSYFLPGEPGKLKVYPTLQGGVQINPTGRQAYPLQPLTREEQAAMALQQRILGKEYQLPKPPVFTGSVPAGGGMYYEKGVPVPRKPAQVAPELQQYRARATGGQTQEDRIKAITKLLDRLIRLSEQ